MGEKNEPVPVHLVIGGGAGGIFCTYELLKKGKVILIEAGGIPEREPAGESPNSESEVISDPQQWGTAFSSDNLSFTKNIKTIPQEGLSGRKIRCPYGHSMGGSTNINAMIWTAGHRAVFDQYWPIQWNSQRMSRLINQVKDILKPIQVHASEPIASIINSVGISSSTDCEIWNESPSQSVYYSSLSLSSSITQRVSLYHQLLHPILHQSISSPSPLTIHSHTSLQAILLYPSSSFSPSLSQLYRAIGIITSHSHSLSLSHSLSYQFHCPLSGGEIILATGSLHSPTHLLNSILLPIDYPIKTLQQNDQKQLNSLLHDNHFPLFASLHSERQRERAEQGEREAREEKIHPLLDHTILPVICIGNWRGNSKPDIGRRKNEPENSVHGWVFLNSNGEIYNPEREKERVLPPSIQLVFVDGRILCGSMFPEMILPHLSWEWYTQTIRPVLFRFFLSLVSLSCVKWFFSRYIWGVLVCNVQPTRPSYREDCDGRQTYRIDPAYGSSLQDISVLWKALKTTRRLISFFPSFSLEILPGPLFLYTFSLSLFSLFFRLFSGSYFHYSGTIPMRNSKERSLKREGERKRESLLDEELRVIDVEGLRVVDASVFPAIPSSPIAAIVMAIGIGAGELINKGV